MNRKRKKKKRKFTQRQRNVEMKTKEQEQRGTKEYFIHDERKNNNVYFENINITFNNLVCKKKD